MSIDADPDNPNGKYMYVATPKRDWYEDAIESEEKLPQWSGENYKRARKFIAVRVER